MLKCRTTVHVRYVKSTSPDDVLFWPLTQGETHGDANCYHNLDDNVPSFGNQLGDGVRGIILVAYFKTNLRVQEIVEQLHHNKHCTEYYTER